MIDILGISGTPRRGGNSDQVVKAVLDAAAAEGCATRIVRLRDYDFGTCVGCEKCRKDRVCTRLMDGMQLLYRDIEEAAGLVLVTPVHTYNVSALVKALIELPRMPPSRAPRPSSPASTTTSASGTGSPRSRSQKRAGTQSRLMKPASRSGTKSELAARMPATTTTTAATVRSPAGVELGRSIVMERACRAWEEPDRAPAAGSSGAPPTSPRASLAGGGEP